MDGVVVLREAISEAEYRKDEVIPQIHLLAEGTTTAFVVQFVVFIQAGHLGE